MEHLRNPVYAAIASAVITYTYMYGKDSINGIPPQENSVYIKPAVLNAILVYFIVHAGSVSKETISTEPF